MTSDLLFLAHRIPYPPNKGDKIRSYHILRYLTQRFRVHLGAFVDDEDDWQYAETVAKMCASIKLVALRRRTALARSAIGLLRGEALGLPYYRDPSLQRWVDAVTIDAKPAAIFVFSSTMAQYVTPVNGPATVLDLCDVDSEKWRQYAARHRFPMSWIYGREARLLAAAERKFAARFDAVLLVSNSEADLFKQTAPAVAARTLTMRNGVDTRYFDPRIGFASPFGTNEHAIVFTGAMDYWANGDAVQWFAQAILPRVIERYPNARFYIVGSRPTAAVQQLARQPNIAVTGAVPDVRPFLCHARVVVAPLRIARGIQNKVLEALAMARPLIATSAALDGLDGVTAQGAIAADDAIAYASAVLDILNRDPGEQGIVARRYVCERYGWDASLRLLDQLLVPAVSSAA